MREGIKAQSGHIMKMGTKKEERKKERKKEITVHRACSYL